MYKHLITIAFLLLAGAATAQTQTLKPGIQLNPPAKTLPGGQQLALKPDLTILTASFSGEFCLHECQPFTRILKLKEIKCGWTVQVKNLGPGRSGATRVLLRYFTNEGNRAPTSRDIVSVYQNVPALAPNQVVTVNFPAPTGDNVLANTQLGVTVVVDPDNTISETNESNNNSLINLR